MSKFLVHAETPRQTILETYEGVDEANEAAIIQAGDDAGIPVDVYELVSTYLGRTVVDGHGVSEPRQRWTDVPVPGDARAYRFGKWQDRS